MVSSWFSYLHFKGLQGLYTIAILAFINQMKIWPQEFEMCYLTTSSYFLSYALFIAGTVYEEKEEVRDPLYTVPSKIIQITTYILRRLSEKETYVVKFLIKRPIILFLT